MKKIGSIIALTLAAGAASAGQVNVSGDLSVSRNGNFGVLGFLPGQGADSWSFNASGSGASINGLIQVTNTYDAVSNQQLITLVLTQMTFSSVSFQGTRTVTVDITQDYAVAGPVSFANASHQMNGFNTFSGAGQVATARSDSTHEGTALPTLTRTTNSVGAGNDPFNIGDGAPRTPISVSGVYSIAARYVFTITNNGGSVSINLPDSGVDNATIVLVPLPPAAFAGLGGLALVGVGATIRRRRLSRA
jgi:hypothetical protein